MASPRTQYRKKLESFPLLRWRRRVAQGGIIMVSPVKSKRPTQKFHSPGTVLGPTLHLNTKGTKQQRNYKRAQHSYHSKAKLHRRSSQPGGIFPAADMDCDVMVSASSVDVITKGKPMGQVHNTKFSQVAVAKKLAVKLKCSKKRLKTLFKIYDVDKNGSLELDELIEIVERFCQGEVAAKDVRALVQLMDTDNGGYIAFEEFRKFVLTFADENQAGEWDKGKVTDWKVASNSRHRSSIADMPELARSELTSTPNHLTTTRAQQQRVLRTKERHETRHNRGKAESMGGFQHLNDQSNANLLDPEAYDTIGKYKALGKSMSAKQNLKNSVAKLHVALRSRKSKLKKIFVSFDDDRNGGLDWEEFRHLLQHFLPGEITKSEAMGVIKAIDADGDGLIQWEELEEFVTEYQRGRKKEESTSYYDREWRESKHYSRHRKSLIAMEEGEDGEDEEVEAGRGEGGGVGSATKNPPGMKMRGLKEGKGDEVKTIHTLTRSGQNYRKQQKKHHKKIHRRSSGFGGYLHSPYMNAAELIDPSAQDATKRGISIGTSRKLKDDINSTVNRLYLALKSKTKRKKLHQLVAQFDAGDKGELDPGEFGLLLEYCCPGEITPMQARKVLRELDKNGDGLLQWYEITEFVRNHTAKKMQSTF
jgi:Ca2+-binding EF-hand superfamily protein